MADTPLGKKLGVKPGMRLLIMNAPEGYALNSEALPEGATITDSRDGDEAYDFVQLFVRDQAEIDHQALKAIEAVKAGGLMWFTYPKKTSKIKTDISRDAGWEGVVESGWEPVTQIAIDETWSALRFRPRKEIKARNR